MRAIMPHPVRDSNAQHRSAYASVLGRPGKRTSSNTHAQISMHGCHPVMHHLSGLQHIFTKDTIPCPPIVPFSDQGSFR